MAGYARQQLATTQKTIAAYESGKFMRMMHALDQVKGLLFPDRSELLHDARMKTTVIWRGTGAAIWSVA